MVISEVLSYFNRRHLTKVMNKLDSGEEFVKKDKEIFYWGKFNNCFDKANSMKDSGDFEGFEIQNKKASSALRRYEEVYRAQNGCYRDK